MSIHKVPDSGTGKGVFVQYVPNERPPIRGGPGSESDREAGQNLVSEPANEDEENEQREGRQQGSVIGLQRQNNHINHYRVTWTAQMYQNTTPLHPCSHIYHFAGFCINPNIQTVKSLI